MKTKQISYYIPALTARTRLGQIPKRVRQHNERFVVGRRREAQAVIMSLGDYLRNFRCRCSSPQKSAAQSGNDGHEPALG
jgi:hypothetical protein